MRKRLETPARVLVYGDVFKRKAGAGEYLEVGLFKANPSAERRFKSSLNARRKVGRIQKRRDPAQDH